MTRSAETWVRDHLPVTRLSDTDPRGETILWCVKDVKAGDDVIGKMTVHTYLGVFLSLAGSIIEDEKVSDSDVLAELQNRGIVPK